MSEGAKQEHAREVEQTLEDLRSKMSEHKQKFNKGERQMRQLQDFFPSLSASFGPLVIVCRFAHASWPSLSSKDSAEEDDEMRHSVMLW